MGIRKRPFEWLFPYIVHPHTLLDQNLSVGIFYFELFQSDANFGS